MKSRTRSTTKGHAGAPSRVRKSKADGRISGVYAKKGLGGTTRGKKRSG